MLISVLLQVPDTLNKVTHAVGEISADKSISFLSLFLKGGYILAPIVFLSLVSVLLIINKCIEIRRATKIEKAVQLSFKAQLKNGDIKGATMVLQGSDTSYARIFQHALSRLGKPIKEIESTIETVSNIEVGKLNKNLSYLGLIAGIAPMLGFIGTITGVIKIFYNIAITDNISIGVISGGLYEKMISSGSGLVVGVLAFTGYHILSMMIDKFVTKIEAEAFDFINILQEPAK